MAESSLGLSPHHERSVVDYLHFARFKRAQCVKTVETAFQDLAESRLVEDTFTCEEVREMFTGLCGVVRADVESELINTSHTNVLLLKQLFEQAEKWHLKLQADISELENRELLEAIAQFEQQEFTTSTKHPPTPSHKHSQLEPLNIRGGEKLLQMEIERLKEENRKLQERVHTLEVKASSALSEKDRLKSDLASKATPTATPTSSSNREEVTALQEKISQLQTQLSEVQGADNSATKEELAHTAHELLRVTAELERTKEELEKKFSETAQYRNLRKMLVSKNEQINELRTKLKQYESAGN